MQEDPEDLVRNIERDVRLRRRGDDEPSPEKKPPQTLQEGQQPEHAEQPADEQGKYAGDASGDEDDQETCGLEENLHPAHSRSSGSGTHQERPRDEEEETCTKRRRLMAVDQNIMTIRIKLGLRSCDCVGQKLTKMIFSIEQVQKGFKTQDDVSALGGPQAPHPVLRKDSAH